MSNGAQCFPESLNLLNEAPLTCGELVRLLDGMFDREHVRGQVDERVLGVREMRDQSARRAPGRSHCVYERGGTRSGTTRPAASDPLADTDQCDHTIAAGDILLQPLDERPRSGLEVLLNFDFAADGRHVAAQRFAARLEL